jgi:hypothetical protein
MLKGFAFFIVNATSNAAIKNHVRILHMARFSNSSRRFSRSGGKVQLAAIACAGFLGDTAFLLSFLLNFLYRARIVAVPVPC